MKRSPVKIKTKKALVGGWGEVEGVQRNRSGLKKGVVSLSSREGIFFPNLHFLPLLELSLRRFPTNRLDAIAKEGGAERAKTLWQPLKKVLRTF